jgi:hypothetical protein
MKGAEYLIVNSLIELCCARLGRLFMGKPLLQIFVRILNVKYIGSISNDWREVGQLFGIEQNPFIDQVDTTFFITHCDIPYNHEYYCQYLQLFDNSVANNDTDAEPAMIIEHLRNLRFRG